MVEKHSLGAWLSSSQNSGVLSTPTYMTAKQSSKKDALGRINFILAKLEREAEILGQREMVGVELTWCVTEMMFKNSTLVSSSIRSP